MAVSYLRLFDAVTQFQLKNGALNVSGRLYVYLEGTDDYADLFDENGAQLSQPVVLDNNGRAAGLYVDSKKTYWMKVNDQYDTTLFTIRKMTPCGGGGGSVLSGHYEVVSTDGSVIVDKSVDAGNTTFDLSIPNDGNDLLEWFRSDSYSVIPASTIYKPVCIKGTMSVGDVGVKLKANQYYHVTGHITATKDIERVPYYDEIAVKYYLRSSDLMYDQLVMSSNQIVDYSLGMGQEFEVSTDVMAPCDCELYVSVEGQSVSDGSFALTNMEVHRVYSGCPSIPSGVLTKDEAAATYQPLLTAGDNIVIDQRTWTISATGGGGGGGGSIYTSGDGIIVHNTGDHEIEADFDVIQHKLIAGDGISIDPSTWVISSSNGSGQYTGDNHVIVNNVTKVISLDDDVVIDPNYVHTENNFTNVYKNKLDGIQSGAEQNVQSDWLETDPDDDSFIRNKPAGIVADPDYVHTDYNFTYVFKQKLEGIEDGAERNVQADWNQSDPADDSFIRNKPEVLANKDLVAGTNISLYQTENNVVISAQYAGGSYDTQQISAGNHIVISSDAQISTDLTDSGELAALLQIHQGASDWTTQSAITRDGAQMIIIPDNVNTVSKVVDPAFGSDANNALDSINVPGGLTLRLGYIYHIEFDSFGLIEANNDGYLFAEIVCDITPTRTTSLARSNYYTDAGCLHMSCDVIGNNRPVYFKIHSVKAYTGVNIQDIYRAYPSISVIARKL